MLHRFPRSGLIAGLVVAVIVAACGGSGTGGGAASSGNGAAAGDLTIAFASPADGADVSLPFSVELTASVPLADPSTGEHHAHLYFDSSTDAADYDIVYGTTWQVTRQLSPGEHTIIVALANPDHSLAGPTQQITVNVTGGAGGGEPSGPATTTPPITY